jgi:hypothetical protein
MYSLQGLHVQFTGVVCIVYVGVIYRVYSVPRPSKNKLEAAKKVVVGVAVHVGGVREESMGTIEARFKTCSTSMQYRSSQQVHTQGLILIHPSPGVDLFEKHTCSTDITIV